MIVILNGASASGRTWIAHDMQRLQPNRWVFIDASTLVDYSPIVTHSIPVMIQALAALGHDIIVEETLIGDEELISYIAFLQPYPVTFVGLFCPAEIIQERNELRGMNYGTPLREEELAPIHPSSRRYDLIIETDKERPRLHALRVLSFVDTNPHPPGFKALARELSVKIRRSRFTVIDGKKPKGPPGS